MWGKAVADPRYHGLDLLRQTTISHDFHRLVVALSDSSWAALLELEASFKF